MRLALQMKTRARERWEEVFCCEETIERKERKEKRGEETERSFAFFPCFVCFWAKGKVIFF